MHKVLVGGFDRSGVTVRSIPFLTPKRRERARRLKEGYRASLFSSMATSVLDMRPLPARTAGTIAQRLEAMLLHEVIDPNARRPSLGERVDRESVWSRQPITDGWPSATATVPRPGTTGRWAICSSMCVR